MHPCLVIRHGEPEDRAVSGLDEDRDLSTAGRASMLREAAGLARIAPAPGIVLTSPFLRARETARIISEAYGGIEVVEEPALASGSMPADILDALAARCEGDTGGIALVGHEPDMGRFVSYALAASTRSFVAFRKGSICLVEFPAVPRAGNATLEWALDPPHLEALAPPATQRRNATG